MDMAGHGAGHELSRGGCHVPKSAGSGWYTQKRGFDPTKNKAKSGHEFMSRSCPAPNEPYLSMIAIDNTA